MSEDLTLADLKADQDDLVGDDGGDDGGGGGEWVGELVDRLDERGLLDAIIAQQFDIDMSEMATDGGDVPAGNGGLDADAVATFGKMVIDQVGDVPMSTVVQYAENNPDTVEALIERATGE